MASAQGNRAHLAAEVTRLEKQIEQLVDRIVNADSDALIGAYENRLRSLEAAKVEAKEKIANCGRPLADFDTTYRTAMEFLENPSKMWVFGDLVDKRAALKLTFEGRIRYKRNQGYRTAKAAIPFRIFNGLDCEDSEESEMVPLAGLEPAHLSIPHFECGASTNFTTGARSQPLAKLSAGRNH